MNQGPAGVPAQLAADERASDGSWNGWPPVAQPPGAAWRTEHDRIVLLAAARHALALDLPRTSIR
jgi:hypothetical protein